MSGVLNLILSMVWYEVGNTALDNQLEIDKSKRGKFWLVKTIVAISIIVCAGLVFILH